MDESEVKGIKVRTDIIGDTEKTNKLKGYKAELYLKRLLKDNSEEAIKYLKKKWDLSPYIKYLDLNYAVKYKKYLKDKESKQHIYDKYAETQSIIEILSHRITDLDAKECLRLVDVYEEKEDLFEMIDEIVKYYKSELKLLIPEDIDTVKNM